MSDYVLSLDLVNRDNNYSYAEMGVRECEVRVTKRGGAEVVGVELLVFLQPAGQQRMHHSAHRRRQEQH